MELTLLQAANALRLTRGFSPPSPSTNPKVELDAVIDVAAGGRLLGVEIDFAGTQIQPASALRDWTADPSTAPYVSIQERDRAYIELSSGDDKSARSTPVLVIAELSGDTIAAIVIPRRGHGYEISYPSGNR